MKKLSAILIKFRKNQILSLVYGKICSKMWESKFRDKIEPMIFILLFEIWIYVKSFYYFLHIEVIKIAKIELKMQSPSVSKKKETPEFCRYGKFAPYKFFFYKLCTKRTVEVRVYLSESTGHFVSYETQLDYI